MADLTDDQKSISILLMLAIFASGCSTPMNKPGSPPVTPVSQSSHVPAQFRWSPTTVPYTSQYRVDDSSTVSITNDSTGKEVLLISSTIYDLALKQDGKLSVDLHIDSASTDTTHWQTQSAAHAIATISLRGQIIDLRSTTPTSCKSGIDPEFARLSDLIIALPANPAAIGSQWADTSSTVICHGKIALLQRTIRNYKLLAELSQRNKPVIQLQRITMAQITGVPADSTTSITANGTGSSTATLLLDRDTGKLLESVGTSDLSLSVTTSRGIFPFQQHAKLLIQIN